MQCLSGRAIVVTGAGRGIGRACAHLAGAEGAKVVVNDIEPDQAEAVAEEIRTAGGTAISMPADVSQWLEAETLINRCADEFGAIDGLINNAGRFDMGDAQDIDEPHVRPLIETNIVGVIACGHYALRRMVGRGRGAIVNMVSGAHFGMPHMSVYGATKGAVASLTYAWSLEVGAAGVRVNAISPIARTRMTAATAAWYRDRGLGEIHHERTPDPATNAPLAIWLLSDASSDVNGQIVRIDGRRLSVVAHPVVRHPVLEDDWTIETIDEAFTKTLGRSLVPVGGAPVLRAVYELGESDS